MGWHEVRYYPAIVALRLLFGISTQSSVAEWFPVGVASVGQTEIEG